MKIELDAVVADGRTMEEFQKLVDARHRYLGESTRDSVAAIALDFLRSLRASTTVAKENVRVEVEECSQYVPSFTSNGRTRKVCLRNLSNVRVNLPKNCRLMIDDLSLVKTSKVFKFIWRERGKTYYIIANSMRRAKDLASKMVKKTIKRHKGLAKLAISALMQSTYTGSSNVDNSIPTEKPIHLQGVLKKTESVMGSGDLKSYRLTLEDNLDYAKNALKNGGGEISTCMQKALNMATVRVNAKCKDFLLFKKIDTPFPELKRKQS